MLLDFLLLFGGDRIWTATQNKDKSALIQISRSNYRTMRCVPKPQLFLLCFLSPRPFFLCPPSPSGFVFLVIIAMFPFLKSAQ